MSSGLLLLRLALGGIMAAHGAQKLFGWWGGPGLRGTAGMCDRMAYRVPSLMACGLAIAEFGGGLSLTAGLLTPLGALAVVTVMLNAVYLVHWAKGFFSANGGYEFNLLIAATAVALAAIGPGRFSLDHAIGWDDNLSGVWWGVGVAGLALVTAFLTLTAGRRRPRVAELPAQPLLFVAAVLLAAFVVPHPWGLVLIVGAAVVELAESWFWIRFSRRRRIRAGAETLIGATAKVASDCRPLGQVRVGGELWSARCDAGAGVGETVRIVGREGLTLLVVPQ